MIAAQMARDREQLISDLEAHYRSNGWAVKRAEDGTVRAAGPGEVTWIGAPMTPEDLEQEGIEQRISELAAQRMPAGGELCPLDLLPGDDCEPAVRELVNRIGLADRPHVSVYSRAA